MENNLFLLDCKGIQIKVLTYHLSFIILKKIWKYFTSIAWQCRGKVTYASLYMGYKLVQSFEETDIMYQKPLIFHVVSNPRSAVFTMEWMLLEVTIKIYAQGYSSQHYL